MKQKLKDFVKYNNTIYLIYNRIGSFFIKLLGLFIPIQQKKILFVSFGGKKYDDSPQAIYEKMASSKEYNDYDFVWALIDINTDIPGKHRVVKIDSFSYFIEALSSKFWIINVSAERGLNFKKKETICINTWHGTPIKKIGGEENDNSGKIKPRKADKFDLVCSQSKYDQEIFSRIFNLPLSDVIISDLPRNDALLKYSIESINHIKKSLGIPNYKKVILYMPTYREYTRDSANAVFFNPPMDLTKWQRELGEEYVLLFRAHYLVVKNMEVQENEFVKEVSAYPQLSDLYAISDIMISDYSSSFFDYSILDRPMMCFAYDLKEYEQHRGFYLNLSELPCELDYDEDSLIRHIQNLDYEDAVERTREFHKKYAPYAGTATEKVISEINRRFIKKTS